MKKLHKLLNQLISAQDNVTHVNEKGPEFAANTIALIQERDRCFGEVIEHVKSMLPAQREVDYAEEAF